MPLDVKEGGLQAGVTFGVWEILRYGWPRAVTGMCVFQFLLEYVGFVW